MVLGGEIRLSLLISEHLRGLRSRSGLSKAGAQAMDRESISVTNLGAKEFNCVREEAGLASKALRYQKRVLQDVH